MLPLPCIANRRQPTNTASGEMWGHRPDPSYLCGPGQQVCAERLPHPRAGARAVNWPFQQKPPGPRGQRVQGGGEGRLFTEGGRLVCCWKACGEAATLLCVRSAASRLSQCHRGPPVSEVGPETASARGGKGKEPVILSNLPQGRPLLPSEAGFSCQDAAPAF